MVREIVYTSFFRKPTSERGKSIAQQLGPINLLLQLSRLLEAFARAEEQARGAGQTERRDTNG